MVSLAGVRPVQWICFGFKIKNVGSMAWLQVWVQWLLQDAACPLLTVPNERLSDASDVWASVALSYCILILSYSRCTHAHHPSISEVYQMQKTYKLRT